MDDDNQRFPVDRHEPNVVNARAIWWSCAALIAIIIVATLLNETIVQLFRYSADRAVADAVAPSLAVPQIAPGPQLDSDQSRTLAALRALEHQRLDEYAWVDERRDVARIPIERAMAIASERGVPQTAGRSTSARGPAQ